MSQLTHIEAIEKRLWSAADTLRANSNYASNEYFLPVMGLIFLRHAFSRFLKVKAEIEKKLPSRGGKKRELTKEDFSQRGAIFLRPQAQFNVLVSLPDSVKRDKAIMNAMESIENDYESLRGMLTIIAEMGEIDSASFSIRYDGNWSKGESWIGYDNLKIYLTGFLTDWKSIIIWFQKIRGNRQERSNDFY